MPQWPHIIQTLRTRWGVSQAVLGERIGVDQKTVSRWERGVDAPRRPVQRRLLDLYRSCSDSRQDAAVRARLRNAFWPSTLVASGAVFLEFNQSALMEIGRPAADLRGRSIYGLFGPEVDDVTKRWEESGIFRGDLAMTISLNTIGDEDAPIHVKTLDSPHFTSDGDIWCVCELKRITQADYEGLQRDFGGSTFEIPFDGL